MPRLLRAVFGRTETRAGRRDRRRGGRSSRCASPYFLTLSNCVDLVEAYSVTTILAAGVFVVLVSGGIDISFAATASVAQYLRRLSVATRYGRAGRSRPWRSPALLGIALGSINALLTYYLRVVSIIVTIATSSIYYALLIYFTNADGDLQSAGLVDGPGRRSSATRPRPATSSGSRLPIVVMAGGGRCSPSI